MVACDELAFYLTAEDRKQRTRFAELLRDLVARGRAAGVIVIAATQKPAADVVPSALRDLFGFRLALRCNTPQASDTILGQGWASLGHNAATIAPTQRGIGLLLAEDGLPVRLRCFHLDDQAVDQLAAARAADPHGRSARCRGIRREGSARRDRANVHRLRARRALDPADRSRELQVCAQHGRRRGFAMRASGTSCRNCQLCGAPFRVNSGNHRFCEPTARREVRAHRTSPAASRPQARVPRHASASSESRDLRRCARPLGDATRAR